MTGLSEEKFECLTNEVYPAEEALAFQELVEKYLQGNATLDERGDLEIYALALHTVLTYDPPKPRKGLSEA